TSIWSPTASTTAGRARIVAGVPSRLLPPWLDTEIALTPASTARLASSTRMTPLSRNGPPHCSRSQATSCQVGSAVPIHSPYARLRPVPDLGLEVHRRRDRRRAPVATVGERPVERDDEADRAGPPGPLHPGQDVVLRPGPVELEERLRVGGDDLLDRLGGER